MTTKWQIQQDDRIMDVSLGGIPISPHIMNYISDVTINLLDDGTWFLLATDDNGNAVAIDMTSHRGWQIIQRGFKTESQEE
jgi:hypothetical protein